MTNGAAEYPIPSHQSLATSHFLSLNLFYKEYP